MMLWIAVRKIEFSFVADHRSSSIKSPWKAGRSFAACLAGGLLLASTPSSHAAEDREVYLLNVPNYRWYAGCYGTANGNLFGFWDRNGFPNFYTGPTANGVAPLDDIDSNSGIRSMWASKAGLDGRPENQPGHIDDYWARYLGYTSYSYENTDDDPYVKFGREEHAWDCIGDFIGLSQKKWTNMNDECSGNVDAFSFVYWDASGERRVNYTPPEDAGQPAVDIQSGLRAWSEYRGYSADVMTQLTSFNPETPPGKGFTFEDVKREIDAGYPVLVFLQPTNETARTLSNPVPFPDANPHIHAMLVYGYYDSPDDLDPIEEVRCKNSWGSGDYLRDWNNWAWFGDPNPPFMQYNVRGVICYRPKPKITDIQRSDGKLVLTWDGPSAQLYDVIAEATTNLHHYVIEHSPTLDPPAFSEITEPTTERTATVDECCDGAGYYRVKLLDPTS